MELDRQWPSLQPPAAQPECITPENRRSDCQYPADEDEELPFPIQSIHCPPPEIHLDEIDRLVMKLKTCLLPPI